MTKELAEKIERCFNGNSTTFYYLNGQCTGQDIILLAKEYQKLREENEKLKTALKSIAFECCYSMKQNNQAIARKTLVELEDKDE